MINENIKHLRKTRGMSQEEMAVKLNVVRQTVSKWEKGLSIPDADVLIEMANLLDVSVSQLLGIEESIHSKKAKRKVVVSGKPEKRSDSVCYIFIYDDYNECEK